jgi:two-component system nitrogen regulation response regulator GlnG
MPKLLVVDDEPAILLAFRRAFRESQLELLTADSAEEGLALAREHRPDAVVMDIQMPGMTGLEALGRFRQWDPRCPVILISGKGTTDTAIEATKRGAYDYLLKPLELAQLREVINKALDISRLMRVRTVLAEAEPADERADVIVGRCPAMQEVYKAIGRVAEQDVTVLLTGESGTGKELVARAIYQHGPRVSGPFLAVNCAALAESVLESELFGHEQGAFTGAERRRIGKFEQCDGGTILLDEVGDMSPATQSKMLRVLQEQTFERVGGNETIRTNVRVIAATNRDLAKRVAEGLFRQDLFYRLSVFTIHLPSLRERGDDLGLLVQHYLRRYNAEFNRRVEAVSDQCMELFRGYSWPGNVRELQHHLAAAILRATGPVLVPEFVHLPTGDSVEPADSSGKRLEDFIDERLRAGTDRLHEETVRRVERLLLTRVLQHTGGNQLQAAKILGITRGSVRTKLRELGISIGRTVESGDEKE